MSIEGNGYAIVYGSKRDTVSKNRLPVLQNFTEGGANVSNFSGTGKKSKNRNINAASTTFDRLTNAAIFTLNENVTQFYVTCIDTGPVSTDTSINLKEFILMLIDVEDSAAAVANFANVGAIGDNVAYYPLTYGKRHGPYQCVSSLGSLDFLPSRNLTRIIIEAQ